jgi:Methyltransferase domain
VERQQPKIDPHAHDPGRWGHSMQNLAEIVLPCLDAVGARSVVEIGAYAGDLTELLVDWAAGSGARVTAVDPSPQERLTRLAAERPELELVRETSLAALPRLAPADAVIVDGDHNHYTVSEELRLVAEATGPELPLLMLHDVCWPHGRRDDYYAAERVPPERRQPIHEGGGLHPDEPGVRAGGLPYRGAAAREGGPANGVLTAVEDFVSACDGLRLAIVPAFFGLGVVWREDAPWAGAVADVLDPWDGNPLVARLEANRVFHLAESHVRLVDADRAARREAVLRRLVDSSAFGVAERLSRLRHRLGVARDQPVISRELVRRALDE